MAKAKAGVRRKRVGDAVATVRAAGVYHGKQAKKPTVLWICASSEPCSIAIPNSSGEVEAHIIGPGRMLS